MAEVTYIQAITDALREELIRDPDVFLLGEDIGQYGGAFRVTKDFLEEFGPQRIMDTPLSESAIIGVACGAAMAGMRPVAEMQFMDFITTGFNQVVNVCAKMHYRSGFKVPMVIRGPSGGRVNGGPFHSQNPEAWFVRTPGLKVVAPSTPYDAKGLLKAAIRDNNPVLYFEHKYLYRRIKEELPEGDFIVPIGKGEIKRSGKDATVITYAAMVHLALEVADDLSKEGVEIEVVDLRSLLPYDKDLILDSVRRCNRVLLLHEDTLTGGLAGEWAALIAEHAFEYLDAPIKRVASVDTPVPYAPVLEDFFLPNKEKITKALRDLLEY
ncbi:MAG: alpha-ketoacid dehydrogenase subunit beta [bacterium]|nr:alpha-ketoacid dehydrogenase subunit beta [bacterium]